MDSVYLALGGLIGSGLKAWLTTTQENFSKQSLGDVLIGGAIGFLYPIYPIIDFPVAASIAQKAVMLGVIAYFSADLIPGVLTKIGVKK